MSPLKPCRPRRQHGPRRRSTARGTQSRRHRPTPTSLGELHRSVQSLGSRRGSARRTGCRCGRGCSRDPGESGAPQRPRHTGCSHRAPPEAARWTQMGRFSVGHAGAKMAAGWPGSGHGLARQEEGDQGMPGTWANGGEAMTRRNASSWAPTVRCSTDGSSASERCSLSPPPSASSLDASFGASFGLR